MPQAPWSAIRLLRIVSKLPPEISMPVPTAGSSPEVGTLALLLWVMRLCSMIRHDAVWLFGHRPSCGGGASSLLSEFGASPVRLWSKTEFVITNRPPALVPEYPSAELLPRSKASLASQTRWHAPT